MSDLISRQDAIEALGEEPEVWNETADEWAYRDAWVEHISALKALPSAEPKMVGNTNADEIYNYLKERIGGIVDDMKEFDNWFERMVWHVKECDRLTAEPKTGEWKKISPARIYECSECGQNVMTDDIEAYKFFHGCGVKMRGEEE